MGGPNRVGVSLTVSPTATCALPISNVYCQNACTISGWGGSLTMVANSLVLVAGVSYTSITTNAVNTFAWTDPTYVGAAGTATAISAGVQAADQFGRNAYTRSEERRV